MAPETRPAAALPESATTAGINVVAVVQLIVASVGLTFILLFRDLLIGLDFATLCTLTTVYAVALIILSSMMTSAGFWSPASAYLGLLTVFHFGLVGVYGFGLLSGDAFRTYSGWFLTSYTPYAVVLAVLGVNACAVGSSLTSLTHRRQRTPAPGLADTGVNPSVTYYLTLIGGALVVLGVVGWFGIVVLSGGPGLLLSSYGEYLEATERQPVAYVWIAMGFGLSFLTGTSGVRLSPVHRLAYAAFLIFAVFALPLGLRGEVLFTSLAAVIIRARRGRVPSLRTSLVAVVVVLVIISAIRDFRQTGFNSGESVVVQGNVLDGLTELGASLRPVGLVVTWRNQGEPFIHGQSYWAPIDRASCRVLLARQCPPAARDDRLMNVLVQQRVGPIGFSPIAEAYRNFGQTGVVLILGLTGVLVGALSRWSGTPLHNAIAGVILVELFINVRNAFTAVPVHLVLGLACVLVAVVLSRYVVVHRRSRETPQPLNGIHGEAR